MSNSIEQIKVKVEDGLPYIDGRLCSFETIEIRSEIEGLAELNEEFILPNKYTYEITKINGFAKIVKRKNDEPSVATGIRELKEELRSTLAGFLTHKVAPDVKQELRKRYDELTKELERKSTTGDASSNGAGNKMYETPTGALISANDYQYLSDAQKNQCKPYLPPPINIDINSWITNKGETKEPVLLQELIDIRNKLYDSLPTGEVKAWDLIEAIKWHCNDLDNFCEKLKNQSPVEPDKLQDDDEEDDLYDAVRHLRNDNNLAKEILNDISSANGWEDFSRLLLSYNQNKIAQIIVEKIILTAMKEYRYARKENTFSDLEKLTDEIQGIMYKYSTDESDEGKWIESKHYYLVAGRIAQLLKNTKNK